MRPRALGIDFGEKRIGVAVSDPLGIGARPLEVVTAVPRDRAADRVAELARELGVEILVVGMPFNMDGTAHDSEVQVRAFARRCQERTGLPVEYIDERLTTIEAQQVMRANGGKRKKRQRDEIDMVAAAVLLRDWLDRRPT